MWKVLWLLMHLLNLVLNKPLEAGEDIFDYDLLENYMANATASDDGMMTMEELLARIREVQESRIPKDKLLDLLEDEEEEEVGGMSESDWDAIDNPPPQPPSPESKEKAGCVVHYHYHYH